MCYFYFHVLPPGVGGDASETSGGGPSGGGDALHQSRLPRHHGHHGEPGPTPTPPAEGWLSDVAQWGVHAPHSTPGEDYVFLLPYSGLGPFQTLKVQPKLVRLGWGWSGVLS